jgi:hypothetical protein
MRPATCWASPMAGSIELATGLTPQRKQGDRCVAVRRASPCFRRTYPPLGHPFGCGSPCKLPFGGAMIKPSSSNVGPSQGGRATYQWNPRDDSDRGADAAAIPVPSLTFPHLRPRPPARLEGLTLRGLHPPMRRGRSCVSRDGADRSDSAPSLPRRGIRRCAEEPEHHFAGRSLSLLGRDPTLRQRSP